MLQLPQTVQINRCKQAAALTLPTLQRIAQLKIYILGLSPLGLSIAADLLLLQPRALTINDNQLVRPQDLSATIHFHPTHLHRTPRAEASLPYLQSLARNVSLTLSKDISPEQVASQYDCIVVADQYDRRLLLELNAQTRKHGKAFFYAGSMGLYSFMFNDLGPTHQVRETFSQPLQVESISQAEQGKVRLIKQANRPTQLQNGDRVCFRNVQGMTEINQKTYTISNVDEDSFTIGDTSTFSAYLKGGAVLKIEPGIKMQFEGLEESLKGPAKQTSDSELTTGTTALPLLVNALFDFCADHGRLPQPLEAPEAAQIGQLVIRQQSNFKQDQSSAWSAHSQWATDIALCADIQIAPTCSFWAGMVASEIIKSTGHAMPLRGWAHHHLGKEIASQTNISKQQIEKEVPDDRTYCYRLLFGNEVVAVLANANILVAGAGSVGCKMTAILAAMGACRKGSLYVVDSEVVRQPNGSNNCLLGEAHLNHTKVQAVEKAFGGSGCKVVGINAYFSQKQSEVLAQQQWQKLDLLVSTIRSVSANKSIDKQCLWYEKPWVVCEGGGMQAHTQVILPRLTTNYIPQEHLNYQIGMKHPPSSFPYKIEHVVTQVSRLFRQTFIQISQCLQLFDSDRETFKMRISNQWHGANKLNLLLKIQKVIRARKARQFQVCLDMAFDLFQEQQAKIQYLLLEFPPGLLNQDQRPFWGGSRRVPHVQKLDLSDPLHQTFILSAATLFSRMVEIKPLAPQKVLDLARQHHYREHLPKDMVHQKDKDEQIEAAIRKTIAKMDGYEKTIPIKPMEEDYYSPVQLSFIYAATNLRARTFAIEEIDRLTVHRLASNLKPSLPPSTSVVAGLAAMQVIKCLLGTQKPVNYSVSLATPGLCRSTPKGAEVIRDKEFDPIMLGPIKILPQMFTLWDKLEIAGPMTLGQMKRYFLQTYRTTTEIICYEQTIIYSKFIRKNPSPEDTDIVQAIEAKIKHKITSKYVNLTISCTLENGLDVDFPTIKYAL